MKGALFCSIFVNHIVADVLAVLRSGDLTGGFRGLSGARSGPLSSLHLVLASMYSNRQLRKSAYLLLLELVLR